MSGRAVLVALGSLLLGCSPARVEVIALAPDSLRLGMLAHWACDDPGGDKLVDRSGNGHDATLFGASFTAGRFGGAVHLDAGAWGEVPDFPQASSTGWSVALWYRPLAAGLADGPLTLFGNPQAGGGWAVTARLAAADAQYRFEYPLGSASVTEVETEPMTVGGWVHLAAVVDGLGRTLSLFANGELVATTSLTAPIRPGSPQLSLGHGSEDRYPAIGDLDDIVVFNRALIAAEIDELGVRPPPDPR